MRMWSQLSEMMQRVGDEFRTQVNAVGLQGTMNAWVALMAGLVSVFAMAAPAGTIDELVIGLLTDNDTNDMFTAGGVQGLLMKQL